MTIASFGFPSLPSGYSNGSPVSGVGSTGASPTGATPASQGIPGLAPNVQAQTSIDTMLISSLQQSSSFGAGLNSDLYTAIGKQSMGLLSGGRTAFELADISLGIDNSQKDYSNPVPTLAPSSAASTAAVGAAAVNNNPTNNTTGGTAPASTSPTASPSASPLDSILAADGFTYQPDPYVYQKDFFAGQNSASPIPAAPVYANASLSGGTVGTLLNSLG